MASSHDKTEKLPPSEENKNKDLTENPIAHDEEKAGGMKSNDIVEVDSESNVEFYAKIHDETNIGSVAMPSNEDDAPIAESTKTEEMEEANKEDPPEDQVESTLESTIVFKRSRSIEDEDVDEDKSQKDPSHFGETDEATEEPESQEVLTTMETASAIVERQEGSIEKQPKTLSIQLDLENQKTAEKNPTETEGKDESHQNTVDEESKADQPEIPQPDKEADVSTESPEIEIEKEKEEDKKETEEREKSAENLSDDESSDDGSTGLNASSSERGLTRATDSLHADIDSMRETSNTFSDLENLLTSPTNESKGQTSIDSNGGGVTPNIDNRRDASERELPVVENILLEEREEEQVSSKSSKPENDVIGDESQSKISKNLDESDSISKHSSTIDHNPDNIGVFEEKPKMPPSDSVPTLLSTEPEKPIGSSNHSQLKDLEALLQSNPPSAKNSVTLSAAKTSAASSAGNQSTASSVNDDKSKDLQRLEDILLGSTPSRAESKVASEDEQNPSEHDDLLIDSGRDPDLQHLEDLMRGSTPYKNRSNSTLNDSVLNAMDEIQAESERSAPILSTLPENMIPPTDLLELVHASVASVARSANNEKEDSQPSVTNEKASPKSSVANEKSSPKEDSPLSLPNSNQSNQKIEGSCPIPHHDSGEGLSVFSDAASRQGLSVFSDATSGQDFLRHVENAKKQMQAIDDEMSQLKGVSDSHSRSILATANSTHTSSNNKSSALPLETKSSLPLETKPPLPLEATRDEESVESPIPRERKPAKEKPRPKEPPTRRKEDTLKRSSSSDEKKKKEMRKTSKKKQVRPNKETPTGGMEPDGKVTRKLYGNRKERNRDASAKSGVGNMEEICKNDPPMVIEGHLEAEETPIEKKTKKKKKQKKQKKKENRDISKYEEPFEEDVGMADMGSIVSARMDRGDDGWSVPVDEVRIDSYEDEDDGVPRNVDTSKSGDPQKEYDPWEEVPCSWCCRYLPHTLVVATTQAYRLDKADEKENERLSDLL